LSQTVSFTACSPIPASLVTEEDEAILAAFGIETFEEKNGLMTLAGNDFSWETRDLFAGDGKPAGEDTLKECLRRILARGAGAVPPLRIVIQSYGFPFTEERNYAEGWLVTPESVRTLSLKAWFDGQEKTAAEKKSA